MTVIPDCSVCGGHGSVDSNRQKARVRPLHRLPHRHLETEIPVRVSAGWTGNSPQMSEPVLLGKPGVRAYAPGMKSSTAQSFLYLLTLSMPTPSAHPKNTTGVQPSYAVNVEGREVGCEFLVNDIPVVRNAYPGTVSKFWINPWLIDGTNSFTIRSLPVPAATRKHPEWDANAARSCTAMISRTSDPGVSMTTVAEAAVNPSESAPALAKSGSFTVELSYATPAWAHSVKISKDAATEKRIYGKYREFHRFLEIRDLPGIMKFSAAKFRDYSRSLDDPNFATKKHDSFKEQFASPSELVPLAEAKDGLRFEYYHGDRLVSIKGDDNRSIIQYYDAADGRTTQYPLFFYFNGKDFVLIL